MRTNKQKDLKARYLNDYTDNSLLLTISTPIFSPKKQYNANNMQLIFKKFYEKGFNIKKNN